MTSLRLSPRPDRDHSGHRCRSSRNIHLVVLALALAALVVVPASVHAQADELSRKLANPLSQLTSLPFQENGDFGIGENSAYRNTLNVQPVWPLMVNEKWSAITRTILPVVYQQETAPGVGNRWGIGDLTGTLFLSPSGSKRPMWGVGPAMLIPTATSEFIGGGKWGIGPSAVAIWENGPWTFGGLAQQIWSFTGDSARSDISSLFLQPTVVRQMGNGISLTANLEATRDFKQDTWNVPLNLLASKVTTVGRQPVSLGAGVRFYLKTPTSEGPDWGIRFSVTLLYPK